MDKSVVCLSLWDLLGEARDGREASGRRYELRGVLAVVLGAILAGRTSLAAIARWGRKLSRKQLKELGIFRRKAPCHATYHNVLKKMDVCSLEDALSRWARGFLGADGITQIAMDGKTLRGSRSGQYPGIHLLVAYCNAVGAVVGQVRVGEQTNEITAAMDLLKRVPLEGKLVTGDAIFAQREICQRIVDGGGDYLFAVKGNQEGLQEAIGTAFSEPVSPLGEAQAAG